MDELSERYGQLLAGAYDCVDRIVLNAYFPLGHNPGGLRVWWRLHDNSARECDARSGRPVANLLVPIAMLSASVRVHTDRGADGKLGSIGRHRALSARARPANRPLRVPVPTAPASTGRDGQALGGGSSQKGLV